MNARSGRSGRSERKQSHQGSHDVGMFCSFCFEIEKVDGR